MKREEKAKKVSFFTRLKTNKELLVLSMPGAIWFLLFAYLPLFGILVAFKRYRLSGNFFESLISSEFVGLDNFKFLFSSGDAWIILRNTVLYNATFIILGVVLPVIVALLLPAAIPPGPCNKIQKTSHYRKFRKSVKGIYTPVF